MSIKSRMETELYITLSDGNKKLKSNDQTSFLIWNLPARITCPYATIECSRFCYAGKAETAYPDVLPARLAHLEMSRQDNFVERMIFTIDTELMRPKNKTRKIVFRIHESGDFYNKAYVDKWVEIMRHYRNNKKIVFVAYTKSLKFFEGEDLPKNFFLLASVWIDTKKENLDIIAKENYRIYTAFSHEDMKTAKGYSVCRCEDCATCGKCWNRRCKNIACEIH